MWQLTATTSGMCWMVLIWVCQINKKELKTKKVISMAKYSIELHTVMYSGCIRVLCDDSKNLLRPTSSEIPGSATEIFLPMICNLHAADTGHTRYTRSACSAPQSACSWGRHRRGPQTGAACCLVKIQNSKLLNIEHTGLYYCIKQM